MSIYFDIISFQISLRTIFNNRVTTDKMQADLNHHRAEDRRKNMQVRKLEIEVEGLKAKLRQAEQKLKENRPGMTPYLRRTFFSTILFMYDFHDF